MRDRKLDAVLMSAHALPAFRHGQSADLLLSACYAYWANLLEKPVGTVPVSRVQQDETFSKRQTDLDIVKRIARETEIGTEGLPRGVYVVTPHWRDDIVLAVMRVNEPRVDVSCAPGTDLNAGTNP